MMGLFSQKEACPVCGQEVKGMFLVKIGDKQTLCKDCSKRISMSQELLKTATPAGIQEHLAYRQKNAETYSALHWTERYTAPGFTMGVDPAAGCFYMIHDDLRDEDNPVVFSFDQVTDYQLYRLKKKMDSAEDPGETPLENGLSVLAGLSRMAGKSNSTGYFRILITTPDPYWPQMDLKISFVASQLHGFGGFGEDMKKICQLLKKAARKELSGK